MRHLATITIGLAMILSMIGAELDGPRRPGDAVAPAQTGGGSVVAVSFASLTPSGPAHLAELSTASRCYRYGKGSSRKHKVRKGYPCVGFLPGASGVFPGIAPAPAIVPGTPPTIVTFGNGAGSGITTFGHGPGTTVTDTGPFGNLRRTYGGR
jgi:hypothetical protein